ncbi:MAG TPA: hypothetical protein PL182_07835 [Pseudobdellovibrionaceae bacterium]|nr:hypothetical protein [Pseudobdellovibrionaceae bacterium]
MKRMMKLTTLALLSLGMLAACGKKGSGGTAATTGLTQNCVNCAGINASLFATAQIQDANIAGVLELHGQDFQVQQAYQEAAVKLGIPYHYYRGPVIVTGQFNINSPIQTGSCVVPAGTYQVRTVSVGQKIESGAGTPFMVQEVILDGTYDISASIPVAYFFSNGQISMSLTLKSAPQIYNQAVNGPCM